MIDIFCTYKIEKAEKLYVCFYYEHKNLDSATLQLNNTVLNTYFWEIKCIHYYSMGMPRNVSVIKFTFLMS